MNPLAVFLANTKLEALSCDVAQIRQVLITVWRTLSRSKKFKPDDGDRHQYLAKWFAPNILADIDRLRIAIQEKAGGHTNLLLTIASDLLRDWSLQDPGDLRIRRRQTPLPSEPFLEAWREAVLARVAVIENIQPLLRLTPPLSVARLGDSRVSASFKNSGGKSDFVITSPPYATGRDFFPVKMLEMIGAG
jgi:site-specific DNA-methyltransferase (cytosine-N4-specific)